MNYYFDKTINHDFEESIEKVTDVLKQEGFGILARIDMHKTLKEKINIDFRKYTILEACNPPFAYRSLQAEENIGIMLPCNIVIQEVGENKVKVSMVNPVVAMQNVKNPKMDDIASEIKQKLQKAINSL
ncbi:MAG TPA: DUF302 domain-containing protein [Bacteroidetes bacterium]|nr:DUF302 domain-containing protein [Bacteroidota bacterium]